MSFIISKSDYTIKERAELRPTRWNRITTVPIVWVFSGPLKKLHCDSHSLSSIECQNATNERSKNPESTNFATVFLPVQQSHSKARYIYTILAYCFVLWCVVGVLKPIIQSAAYVWKFMKLLFASTVWFSETVLLHDHISFIHAHMDILGNHFKGDCLDNR